MQLCYELEKAWISFWIQIRTTRHLWRIGKKAETEHWRSWNTIDLCY